VGQIDRVVGWADRIYHLAAVVGVYRVLAEPTKVLATNIAGCERLLRAAHAGSWKPQVVLASSPRSTATTTKTSCAKTRTCRSARAPARAGATR
jgi:nucleoside-diphosphate-sugar epimerase